MKRKLNKLLLSHAGTAILFLLFCDAIIFYWYAALYMRHRILFPVFLLLAAACAIPAYKLFIFLWRNKWRDKISAAAKRIYSKYGARLFRALEKLGFGNEDRLGGRSSIIFNFRSEKESTKKKKPPKWKNLKNEKQRLGYLYRAVIMKKLKKGEKIYAFETPHNINKRIPTEGAESEIMDMYCKMRYSTLSPDGEDVDRLKRELEA
ncbi:MAG: hypothetical protein E7619_07035 [Ruminococcaceae bacterium]|nr:hypothetical protein [Oscillospiraceae bacterium]